MSDAINRTLAARARQILRIEQGLLVVSGVFTVILLAASIYFEKIYGVRPYSFAFAAVFFTVSVACFWALFEAFKDSFQYRARSRGTRAMFTLASAYVVLASIVAYAVSFGLFGLNVPWAGAGREHLYAGYFLLSVAAAFLARSAMFYWRLRAYVTQSLNDLAR